MSFDEALKVASRDERFMATIYAMNTLLIHKGIYTTEEFESIFIEWVNKEQRKKLVLLTLLLRFFAKLRPKNILA
jgi:hypothetical protein